MNPFISVKSQIYDSMKVHNKSSWERNVKKEWVKSESWRCSWIPCVLLGAAISTHHTPQTQEDIGKRAVYTLVSLLCDEEISPGSTVSSSLGLYMFPFPEPEALGVGATKADCHKTESPTELVGQSLNHKHLELLRLLSYWGAALQIAA